MTESVFGSLTLTKLKGQATDKQAAGREKLLRCMFMAGSDRGRYKPIVDELCNDYQKTKDKSKTTFPETRAAALKLLTKRRGDDKKSSKKDDYEDGVHSFFQVPPKGRRKRNGKHCTRCGKWNHKAKDCQATDAELLDLADDDRSRRSVQTSVSERDRAVRRAATNEWSG